MGKIIETVLNDHNDVTPTFRYNPGDRQFGPSPRGRCYAFIRRRSAKTNGNTQMVLEIAVPQDDGSLYWDTEQNYQNVSQGANSTVAQNRRYEEVIEGAVYRIRLNQSGQANQDILVQVCGTNLELVD